MNKYKVKLTEKQIILLLRGLECLDYSNDKQLNLRVRYLTTKLNVVLIKNGREE